MIRRGKAALRRAPTTPRDADAARAPNEAAMDDAVGDRDAPNDRASFVDDDGTRYDWDDARERFVARDDDATTRDADAMTYDGASDAEEIARAVKTFDAINALRRATEEDAQDGEDARRARKRAAALERAAERAKRAKAKRQGEGFDGNKNVKSTGAYVTGLPSDATEEELGEAFKKCGVVKLDAKTGRARVKVYRDADGKVKGDGLVVFLKAPSVDLAIALLDQTELRLGDATTRMTVTAAKFEAKARGDDEGGGAKVAAKASGGGARMTKADRKRAAALLKRQEAEALGWAGFDDDVDAKKLIVVLRRMFTLEEMYADANLRKELEEDVMEEAQRTCGPVMSVKTYTTSQDGTMTIRFKSLEAVEACVKAWNGRWFDGRQIEASMWDGKSKFVSQRDESEAAQRARLDAYAAELGGGSDAEDAEDDDEDDDDDDEHSDDEQ